MNRIWYLIVIVILLCSEFTSVYSQWSNDPAINTLVCNAEENQREPSIITDDNGGAIISWRDYRYNNSVYGGDIMAQRLDKQGSSVWTANGMAVNASEPGKGYFSPVMVEDGHGGAVTGWGRTPGFIYNYDIFAQKIDADGARLWSVNDVAVSVRSGTESFHQIISDDSCGAVLTWSHLPGTPGSTDIYAQRVDSTGNIVWTVNGEEICMAAESQSYPKLTGDGNSGAIITWSDSRDGVVESDIYAQRISYDGTVLWTADGVEVSNYLYFQDSPVIVSDGAGGAIIAWQDTRAGNYDIYAQRINADGEFMWTEHGIPVCSASQNQQYPEMVSDGEGGAIIIWQDDRNGNQDIYAQRVNGSGELQWTANGEIVTTATGNQNDYLAIPDNASGIIITWVDYRSDAFGDIYCQKINSAGTALWDENGAAVCTVSGYQESPRPGTDKDGGAIITWSDMRNGNDYNIYAQLINKTGGLGPIDDDDLDGIPDEEEYGPAGDNTEYDGNSDGLPDCQQSNVASFNTYDQQQYVTLAVPESENLQNVKAIGNPDSGAQNAPEEGSYPYGFFSFTITGLETGGSTIATLFLHNGPGVDNYYKYGPGPGQEISWYNFDYDEETGAVIDEDRIYLHLTDGIRGDYDITADGKITDPGGPVLLATDIELDIMPTFILESVYPNPFMNRITIAFSIEQQSEVMIEIFDLTGRLVDRVFNSILPAGKHQITWDATGIHKGAYMLRLSSGTQSLTHMIIKSR